MLFNSVFTIFWDFNIQCRVCYTACSVNRRETVSLFKFPIKSLMIPFELNWPVSLITIYILYVIVTSGAGPRAMGTERGRWSGLQAWSSLVFQCRHSSFYSFRSSSVGLETGEWRRCRSLSFTPPASLRSHGSRPRPTRHSYHYISVENAGRLIYIRQGKARQVYLYSTFHTHW